MLYAQKVQYEHTVAIYRLNMKAELRKVELFHYLGCTVSHVDKNMLVMQKHPQKW